ncbi:MAG TPA: LysE family translocator [Gaiellaceae bacterium]|nr:LysE family translocator [Gaiellaceae bacterium]
MSHIAAFLGIAAIVIVTPGPDTALTVRNTLFGGRARGLATSLGVATGLLVWTVTASAGVAAIVTASQPLFTAIRVGGAAYLVWLGVQTVRGHRGTAAPPAPGSGYRQGLLSNLGNPKIVVFFTSLLPQFGTGFAGLVALGLVFCAMTFAWLAAYAAAVARARRTLLRPRVQRAIDTMAGVTLVAFGVRLAAERG